MRRWFVISTMILVCATPAGAQFVGPGGAIPAVADIRGPGVFWRSDVSVLNLNSADTSVMFYLLPELKDSGPAFDFQTAGPFSIPGNGQLTRASVVTSVFGLRNVKGGLQVISLDGSPLVLASRTYTNADTGGSYGLNVYGVPLIDTSEAWLANVEHDGSYRTNIGGFLPVGPGEGNSLIFTVTIRDDGGVEVASGSLVFEQEGLRQKSLAFFGVEGALLDGSVEFHCSDSSFVWYAYATVIDNVTGDSVYRAALTRQTSFP